MTRELKHISGKITQESLDIVKGICKKTSVSRGTVLEIAMMELSKMNPSELLSALRAEQANRMGNLDNNILSDLLPKNTVKQLELTKKVNKDEATKS